MSGFCRMRRLSETSHSGRFFTQKCISSTGRLESFFFCFVLFCQHVSLILGIAEKTHTQSPLSCSVVAGCYNIYNDPNTIIAQYWLFESWHLLPLNLLLHPRLDKNCLSHFLVNNFILFFVFFVCLFVLFFGLVVCLLFRFGKHKFLKFSWRRERLCSRNWVGNKKDMC